MITEQEIIKYDRENPMVWEMFKKFALELIERGYERIGAKMIFERIRWETTVAGNDQFKINNNYTPYYARKFEQVYPQHSEVFSKRAAKSC